MVCVCSYCGRYYIHYPFICIDDVQVLENKVLSSGCRSSLIILCANHSYDLRKLHNENEESLLHIACRSGHLDIVRALIEIYHCSLEITDKFGNSPCHMAFEAGQLIIMDYFDKCPYPLYYPSKNSAGNTLLHLACMAGSIPLIRMIIVGHSCNLPASERNIKLNKYNDEVLSVLGRYGKMEDVHSRNRSGHTPLHIACLYNQAHVIKFFFHEYQETSNDSFTHQIPSLLNLAYEQRNYELASFLTSRLDMNYIAQQKCSYYGRRHGFKTKSDFSPFIVYPHFENFIEGEKCRLGDSEACSLVPEHILFSAARRGDKNMFDHISEFICDCDPSIFSSKNAYGDTLLHAVCVSCNAKLVKEIYNLLTINNHMKLDELKKAKNSFGYTCLHIVSELGSRELTEVFIDYGFSVNDRTYLGYTPLHLSVLYERKDVFEYLMTIPDVDLNIESSNDETPLNIAAAEANRIEYVKRIVEHDKHYANIKDNSGEIPLFNACRTHSMELVNKLLETSNILATNNRNENIAFIACRFQWTELFDQVYPQLKHDQSLLKAACYSYKTDEKSSDLKKKVPEVEMLSYLYKNYKDFFVENINKPCSESGLTLLQHVCKYHNVEAFKYLLILPECDCDAQSQDGNTVLHICCESNIKMLAHHCIEKCSISIHNKDGATALHVALASRHYSLLKSLLYKVEPSRLKTCISKKGDNILHAAAADSPASDIVSLILSKKLIHHCSKSLMTGNTALHIACDAYVLESAKYLMEADLEYTPESWYNKKHHSPLMSALRYNDFSYFEEIISLMPKKYQKKPFYMCRWSDGSDIVDVPLVL